MNSEKLNGRIKNEEFAFQAAQPVQRKQPKSYKDKFTSWMYNTAKSL